MKNIISELEKIISTYSEKLSDVNAQDAGKKANPDKWSPKEELGHIIDSAHNNLTRFVLGQYLENPKIVYSPDEWVRLNDYQNSDFSELVSLWILMNKKLISVLRTMPANAYNRMCDTGRQSSELHTLQWLAEDYVKHLMHHLHHLLGMEEIKY